MTFSTLVCAGENVPEPVPIGVWIDDQSETSIQQFARVLAEIKLFFAGVASEFKVYLHLLLIPVPLFSVHRAFLVDSTEKMNP